MSFAPVMTHYPDANGWPRIATYQVWNEGSVSTFWAGPAQPDSRPIVWQLRNQYAPDSVVVAASFAVGLPHERRWVRITAQVVGHLGAAGSRPRCRSELRPDRAPATYPERDRWRT